MAAEGDMYGGMDGTMSPSETRYNIGSTFGDKLISQKGYWMWSPALEGVLVQVSPEGRILIHNPATGETTGEEPVVVRSQDIFKIGKTEPHNITERVEKAVENAFAYYKETPDGKEASKIADVIKAQGLRTSSLQVGSYYKPNFSGTYKFTDKGVEYSGGRDKRTGQSVAPAVYPKSQFDAPPPSGEGGWIYEGEEGYDETMAGAVSPTPTTGGGETPADKPTYFPESTPEGAYQGDFGAMGYTAEEKEKYGIPLSPEEFGELERKGKEEGSLPQSTAPAPTPTPTGTPTGTPTEKANPLEQGYYFGYGGAGEKGSELAQSDQATLGQDSYILGQSSGLTHRGKTELPPAPFQQRSGAARRARIRQGQWDIAAPKREFLRGQARAVRGATDIATQELLKRTGKTADEIRALKDTDPEQFERLRAERDMHMQNLVNPDRPQFKAEDLGKVMEGGKWTGAYAPETALMEQRKFREKHVEKAFTPEEAKKAGEWTRQLTRERYMKDHGVSASELEAAGEAAYQKAIQGGAGDAEAEEARIAAASHDIDTLLEAEQVSRTAAGTREKARGQVKLFRDAAGKVVGFSKPSGYKTDKEGKRIFDPAAAVSEEKVGEAGKDVKRFVEEGQQIRRSKQLDQLAKSGYLEGKQHVSTGAQARFTPAGVRKAPFGPKGTPLPPPPTLSKEVRSYFPEQQKPTPTLTTKPTTPKRKKPKYSPRRSR